MNIRAARADDRDALLMIWLASVRATHRFLTQEEIEALMPEVTAYFTLPGHGLWVLCDGTNPVGFMGLDGSSLEALFITPDRIGRGGGRALLTHARALANGPLTTDVNEQNPRALAFYLASRFSVVGRSPIDDRGRPYPLLHLLGKRAPD